MSSCGGNCNCGSSCNCDAGCKKSTEVEGNTVSASLILGVAPHKGTLEGGVMVEMNSTAAAAEGGCKCGSGCQCDPCKC